MPALMNLSGRSTSKGAGLSYSGQRQRQEKGVSILPSRFLNTYRRRITTSLTRQIFKIKLVKLSSPYVLMLKIYVWFYRQLSNGSWIHGIAIVWPFRPGDYLDDLTIVTKPSPSRISQVWERVNLWREILIPDETTNIISTANRSWSYWQIIISNLLQEEDL